MFVDARNNTLPFQTSNAAKNTGVLVVWCGRVEMNQNFKGIVLSMFDDENVTVERSDDSTFVIPGCDNTLSGQENVGTYISNGIQCQCWTYAEGGTPSRAGIEIGPNSSIGTYPNGNWSFLNSAFEGPPPTSFQLQAWRELYE